MTLLSEPIFADSNGYSNKSWSNMRVVYRAMGLSKKETEKRVLCKINKVIRGEKNLEECDKILGRKRKWPRKRNWKKVVLKGI